MRSFKSFALIFLLFLSFYFSSNVSASTLNFSNWSDDQKVGYVYLVCKSEWDAQKNATNTNFTFSIPWSASMVSHLNDIIGDVSLYKNVAEIGAKLRLDSQPLRFTSIVFPWVENDSGSIFYNKALSAFPNFSAKAYDMINTFVKPYCDIDLTKIKVMSLAQYSDYYNKLVAKYNVTGWGSAFTDYGMHDWVSHGNVMCDCVIVFDDSDTNTTKLFYRQNDILKDAAGNYLSHDYGVQCSNSEMNLMKIQVVNNVLSFQSKVETMLNSYVAGVKYFAEIVVVPDSSYVAQNTSNVVNVSKDISNIDDSQICDDTGVISPNYITYNIYNTPCVTPSPSASPVPSTTDDNRGLLSKLLDYIKMPFTWIHDCFSSVVDFLNGIGLWCGDFALGLGKLLSFLPAQVVATFCAAFTIIMIITVIRVARGS